MGRSERLASSITSVIAEVLVRTCLLYRDLSLPCAVHTALLTPFLCSLQIVKDPLDPRIHFALVCGAKSCPPIKVYTSGALEEGLEAAASAFCEGELH